MANSSQMVFSSEIVKKYVNITQEADFDFKRDIILTHSIVTGLVVKAGLDDYEAGSVFGALHSTYAFIGLIRPQLASLRNTKKEAELKILNEFERKIERYIRDLPNIQNYHSYISAIMECQKALRFIEKKFALFGFILDQLEEGDL
jgi:hypothetical protein